MCVLGFTTVIAVDVTPRVHGIGSVLSSLTPVDVACMDPVASSVATVGFVWQQGRGAAGVPRVRPCGTAWT